MGGIGMDSNRDTIVIVDDDMTNLAVARNSLSEKYSVATVPSGEKLFLLLDKISPALILLDVEMPDMDGYTVMEKLQSSEKTAHTPVIFLTGKIDPESEIKGLSLGAVDYITKPFSRELLIKRIDLHIMFEKQKKELLKHNLSLESEVDKKTRTVLELQSSILKTVAELVECRDNITGGHIERTQHYLKILIDSAIEHGVYVEELRSWDIELLIMSSQLHDVGKISIRDGILMKPGKLTDEEFEEMKKHTIYGVDIIRRIERTATDNEFLYFAEIMAGSHHEKWNGKGYPYGLEGYDIPLHGRLMALVDVYDALTNERPYKKAFSHEKSVEIIREEKGVHFDPLIADAFLANEQVFARSIVKREIPVCANEKLRPTIMAVANVVGTRGGKPHGHVERMRRYLDILVSALLRHERFNKEILSWDLDLFLMSAQLHDIGKIAVADRVLNKADKLSADEHEQIKSHADYGVKIVQQIKENVDNEDLLHHAETLTGSHHEKWDGTGYPHGLSGEAIPLQGRIMAIVDVYDALTSDRPHRKRKTHKEAVETIINGSGSHFAPELVNAFLECEKEFERAADKEVDHG